MPENAIRRRNVKTRKRTGCVTCRARRLKCDEGKPECNNCTRLTLPCGGYPPRIVFKDQTDRFVLGNETLQSQSPSHRRRTRASKGVPSVASSPKDSPVTSCAVDDVNQLTPCNELVSQDETITVQVDDAVNPEAPNNIGGPPNSVFEAATSLALISGYNVPSRWSHPSHPSAEKIHASAHSSRQEQISDGDISLTPDPNGPGPSPLDGDITDSLSDPSIEKSHGANGECLDESYHGIEAAPVVPPGLLESSIFPQDTLYYHHLRDRSPYGVLSVLYLTDLLDASYLDGSFYHAALALSALKMSQSDAPSPIRKQAAIHALEHFVTALGAIGKIVVEENNNNGAATTPGAGDEPQRREKAISWLSTVLFLAYFELQRGQMRLWYVHSRAAVDFLSQHLSLVVASNIGESLIRAFSRIAALLDIYDRTHSVRKRVMSSEVSNSLVQSLTTSPLPYDRLLFIMPRVNEMEEDWRSNARLDAHLQQRIESLRAELQHWRQSLPDSDVPTFDDEDENELLARLGPGLQSSPSFQVKPFTILKSYEPVRAATNYAHYLVSLLRLDSMYPPGMEQKLTTHEFTSTLYKICRLAAGVPYTLCVRVNAYGHGMLPALMNAWHLAEPPMSTWLRGWMTRIPDIREGIWNVSRVQRLLAYLDQEYGHQGSRAGWYIIKARMVDLDDDRADPLTEGEADSFCIEIYSKGKRGWSIDFVELE